MFSSYNAEVMLDDLGGSASLTCSMVAGDSQPAVLSDGTGSSVPPACKVSLPRI